MDNVCGACSAINRPQARSCDECGQPLGSDVAPAPGRRRRETAGTREERRAATAELHRVHRSIRILRWIYALNAFFSGLGLLAAIAALRDPDAAPRALLIVIGIRSVAFVIFLVGALQVVYYPLAWALAMAGMTTLVVVLEVVLGPVPPDSVAAIVVVGLMTVWTALLWSLVLPALETRRILRESPDLFIAQRLRGLHSALRSDASRAHTEERERLGQLRVWKLSIGAALGTFAIAMFGSYSVYAKVRPARLADALEDFRAAWNASRPDKVAGFLAAGTGASPQALERMQRARGWESGLPVIGEARVDERGATSAEVLYPLRDETLAVLWTLRGNVWKVSEITPPAPPADDVASRFAGAWNASNVAEIAALAETGERDAFIQQLERLRELRGWTATLPALRDPVVDLPSRQTAKVEFQTDSGFLSAKFELEKDMWYLSGITPPRD